jgi:hypothetical protein
MIRHVIAGRLERVDFAASFGCALTVTVNPRKLAEALTQRQRSARQKSAGRE